MFENVGNSPTYGMRFWCCHDYWTAGMHAYQRGLYTPQSYRDHTLQADMYYTPARSQYDILYTCRPTLQGTACDTVLNIATSPY